MDQYGEDPGADAIADKLSTLPDEVLFGEPMGDLERDEALPEDEQPEQEPETEDREPEEGEGEEQLIEIPDPDGGEPEKVALSDLIESHQQLRAFEGQQQQILEQFETQQLERQQQAVQQLDQWLTGTARQLTTWLNAVPMPQAPPTDMLDPTSPNYSPDRYHLQYRQFQDQMGRFQAIQGQLSEVQQYQKQIEAQRLEQVEAVEEERLMRAIPDWGPDVAREMLDGLEKHYGIDFETADSVSDHRFFRMAKDALAYRQMLAKGQQTAKAVKAAPQPAAKATKSAPTGNTPARSADGRFQKEARAALKKTGSMDAAARLFEKFV